MNKSRWVVHYLEIAHFELKNFPQDTLGYADQFDSHKASTLHYEKFEREGHDLGDGYI